ncbi:MAG: DUF4355 domain-containing protein [Candidatus Pacearchaeota archaeon]
MEVDLKMKIWRKLLLYTLLLPVMPILGIPGGSDAGTDPDGDNSAGGDDLKKKDQDGRDAGGSKGSKPKLARKDKNQDGGDAGDAGDAGDTGKKAAEKTFTQEDVDAILTKRIARARKTWEQEMEEEKRKAAMSEAERLKAEKDEAERKAALAIEKANERLVKAAVIAQAAELNIIDPEAAYALIDKEDISVDDMGKVEGVNKALESLIKEKPYLVRKDKDVRRAGDDQGDSHGRKVSSSMNDLIRQAFRRN